MAKFRDLIVVPVTEQMGAEIRRRAQADERTIASFVRLLLAAAMAGKGDGR